MKIPPELEIISICVRESRKFVSQIRRHTTQSHVQTFSKNVQELLKHTIPSKIGSEIFLRIQGSILA